MCFGKNKAVPRLIEFDYSSCGGMRACHFEYSVRKTENGAKIEIAESEGFEFPIRRQSYNVSADVLNAISEITAKHNVHKWHNFKLFKEMLLDAPSLNVRFAFDNGTVVHYGHGEILPEYGVHREVIDLIPTFCKNENSDLLLKEKAEISDSRVFVSVSEVKNGYATVDIMNKTDNRLDSDLSYKIYDGDSLLHEGCIEQEEYRKTEFFPGCKLPVLINLNECGKLHEGIYAIEIMGIRCNFNLAR